MSEQDTSELRNCGTAEDNASQVPESDTRDQLEVDMIKLCHMDMLQARPFFELLDRQAAITERELCARCTPYATTKDYLDTIDKLTTERDNLQAAIDAMNNGQFYSMYKAKCDECERLKKVARTQAESFKKLECELAGKQ